MRQYKKTEWTRENQNLLLEISEKERWFNGPALSSKFFGMIHADKDPVGIPIFKFEQSLMDFSQWINL